MTRYVFAVLAVLAFSAGADAQCQSVQAVVGGRTPIFGHMLRAHHQGIADKHQAIADNISRRQSRRAARTAVIVAVPAEPVAPPAPKTLPNPK